MAGRVGHVETQANAGGEETGGGCLASTTYVPVTGSGLDIVNHRIARSSRRVWSPILAIRRLCCGGNYTST